MVLAQIDVTADDALLVIEGHASAAGRPVMDVAVDDYDLVELLQFLMDTCRDVLDMSAAGILLADPAGQLEVVASTSEASLLVEMMQLSAEAGQCVESFRTGHAISVPDIAEPPAEWEAFRVSALSQGFQSADALPLRLRDATIGTLNLLLATTGPAPADDVLVERRIDP